MKKILKMLLVFFFLLALTGCVDDTVNLEDFLEETVYDGVDYDNVYVKENYSITETKKTYYLFDKETQNVVEIIYSSETDLIVKEGSFEGNLKEKIKIDIEDKVNYLVYEEYCLYETNENWEKDSNYDYYILGYYKMGSYEEAFELLDKYKRDNKK